MVRKEGERFKKITGFFEKVEKNENFKSFFPTYFGGADGGGGFCQFISGNVKNKLFNVITCYVI